jgi:Helix-turn-helix.
MYNSKDFARRLSELRLIKSISARDMSLSLGQSESYINKIENSKAFPSMEMFFYICDFLNISPKDFFDYDVKNPNLIEEIIQDLNSIDYNYVKNIHEIIKGLKN